MKKNMRFVKMTTVIQANDPPDIFQSWGGGGMNDYAKAGLLLDITSYLDMDGWRDTFAPSVLGVYSYQGKNYGMSCDMGMVGFWYNNVYLPKQPEIGHIRMGFEDTPYVIARCLREGRLFNTHWTASRLEIMIRI